MSSEQLLLDSAPALAQAEGDQAEEAYWLAVTQLQATPTKPVFDRCLAWCSSGAPNERRLGADVLGQLGYADRSYPFRRRTYPVLDRLLDDDSPPVVQAALVALGHLGPTHLIPKVAQLSKHADPSVRQAVVSALGAQQDSLAVSTLIELSTDEVASVRDWSTFSLGSQIDLDTVALRDALAARLGDPDPDTRAEAICGLARRKDSRALAAMPFT